MKKIVPFLVITALLFTACNKSNSGSGGSGTDSTGNPGGGGTSSGNFIKSINTISYDIQTPGLKEDSNVISYTYDAQGRSTLIVNNLYDLTAQGKLINSDTTRYNFGSGNFTVTEGKTTTKYYLNAAGKLADSSYKTITGQIGTTVDKYFYDANSYLTKRDEYFLSGGSSVLTIEAIYTIVNGNTTLELDNKDSVLQYTYSSQASVPAINDYIETNGITGHRSIDVLTSATALGLPITFTYTFDSKGRAATITEKLGGVAVDAIVTYVYE